MKGFAAIDFETANNEHSSLSRKNCKVGSVSSNNGLKHISCLMF